MKQTKKQLCFEIFRFLLVGGIATVTDYLVFWLFDGVLFPLINLNPTLALILATALGFCVGLMVNWILSVKFVFKAVKDQKEIKTKKSFLIFALIGAVGLLITELGVLLLVTVLPTVQVFGQTALMGVAWKKWLAKGIMTLLVLVWNYTGRKIFVFKS